MANALQGNLFKILPLRRPNGKTSTERSGTFSDNIKLPIHRWFRYSAGFSATWVKETILNHNARIVLDPFVGSGTVCIAADEAEVISYGIESHPFVFRLAKGKLAWTVNIDNFKQTIFEIEKEAKYMRLKESSEIPSLLAKCYTKEALTSLFMIKEAFLKTASDLSEDLRSLVFLAISAILRPSSHVGTAQWQYILPNKRKAKVLTPLEALTVQVSMMERDMYQMQLAVRDSRATLIQDDARTLRALPDRAVDLVITSPPYANNYDYADATRLEMTFWGEVDSWGDLHETVRRFLIRSSSQHAAKDRLNLDSLLSEPVIEPIRQELSKTCRDLADIRGTKGGKKAYHTMIAAYFADIGQVFHALRRVTKRNGNVCFVIGDSAPYGIYVPVEKWIGELSVAAGFSSWSFEKIRDRNVKWKNRKHTVPLHEGRLWIRG
ncbi:MAG: DNA modification methylase [Deltaproteobacteria bacterium]|nr:DNA modification methylase [Deltaproteobacteria bacterium]